MKVLGTPKLEKVDIINEYETINCIKPQWSGSLLKTFGYTKTVLIAPKNIQILKFSEFLMLWLMTIPII